MITENAVWSDEFIIDAPVELVWKILTDFENYEKWNKFCPSIKTELKLGATVDMMVDLGNGLQPQIEIMCLIEENKAIAWEMTMDSKDVLYACRTQTLKKISETQCSYITVDDFAGELTAAVIESQGENVERGFNLCGSGLKAYAESLVS